MRSVSDEHECAHDQLAELCIHLHQREQLIPIHFDQLGAFLDTQCDQSPSSGEHRSFARKLPRSDVSRDAVARTKRPNCFNRSFRYDEELRSGLSGFGEYLSFFGNAGATVRGNAGDLRISELWEHSLVARRRAPVDAHAGFAVCHFIDASIERPNAAAITASDK